MGCGAQLEQLDVRLAALAREEAGLRLRLGQVLEVMQRGAHCLALGFSSLAAYVLERCERGARWMEVACCLARRLEALPALRSALAVAGISWSKAELLARVAQPAEEAQWLELAQRQTVRQLREGMRARHDQATEAAEFVRGAEREATCQLSCVIDREETWLLEATRTLLERLGTCGSEEQVEALLAEAQCALLAALPPGALELERCDAADAMQRRWCEQLEQWRTTAEARCEPRLQVAREREQAQLRAQQAQWQAQAHGQQGERHGGTIALQAAAGCSTLQGYSSVALDGEVRALASRLARHELDLSLALLQLHRADGWRKLGYATEAQYARERLGMSRSAMLARRALALRLESLPLIAAALGRAELGVEATLQLVRIATPRTELAWLARARLRTVKHLREEVSAALTAVRISGQADCPPPQGAELDGYQELERAVLSGQVWGGTPTHPQPGCTLGSAASAMPDPVAERSRRPWRELLSSLGAWLAQGVLRHPVQGYPVQGHSVQPQSVQMSAPGSQGALRSRAVRSAGRVEVRWRVSLSTRSWWQALEAQARRWLPRNVSWVKYLCLVFWRAWGHVLGTDVAYGDVYVRDRCRCSSPVCNRRDVTPHHLRFRSAGGGDEPANIASLCTWCHLFGVHGGRIRATGTAHCIHWELGPPVQPCLRVEGRERVQGR